MSHSHSPLLASIKNLFRKNKKQILEDYFTFLSYPSVSSEVEYKKQVLECAEWLTQYIKQMGLQVELWQTANHPVIFASDLRAGPDKPTLLIYNHYDVQPVDPIGEWSSPPFTPTQRDDHIYARGAQDNKGQCLYVLQAIKLLLELHGKLPINVKLCIEGEEEMGSPGLSQLLKQKKEEFQADYVAVADLGLRDKRIPALTLGIRGLISLEVTVKGPDMDLHSGSHGGIIVNPVHALVELLASLHDRQGRVTVPGFYDQVAPVPVEERAKLSFYFDVADYRLLTGAYPSGGEKEFSALERAWIRPTLEINGIGGGYIGKGVKTIIPSKATAKITCRLVPNQDPDYTNELVANFLRSNAPQGVQVNVQIHPGGGKALRTSLSSKVVHAFSRAFEEVFEMPTEFILDGASIPIAAELAEVSCGGEMVLFGLGLPSDLIHAPNEHFGFDRLEKGTLVVARTIELLS